MSISTNGTNGTHRANGHRHDPFAGPFTVPPGSRMPSERSKLPRDLRRGITNAQRAMKMSREVWRAWCSIYCASPRRLREWAASPQSINRIARDKVFVFTFTNEKLTALDHHEMCGTSVTVCYTRCRNHHDPARTIERWQKMFGIEPYGPTMWAGDAFAVDALAKHAERVTLTTEVDRDGTPTPQRVEKEHEPESAMGFLILTRRKDEAVTIITPEGRFGEVFVTGIRGNTVRLGFRFDDDVSINRAEIGERANWPRE